MEQIQKDIKDLRELLTRQSRGDVAVKCFGCGGSGRVKKECRAFCKRCRKPGHWAKHCMTTIVPQRNFAPVKRCGPPGNEGNQNFGNRNFMKKYSHVNVNKDFELDQYEQLLLIKNDNEENLNMIASLFHEVDTDEINLIDLVNENVQADFYEIDYTKMNKYLEDNMDCMYIDEIDTWLCTVGCKDFTNHGKKRIKFNFDLCDFQLFENIEAFGLLNEMNEENFENEKYCFQNLLNSEIEYNTENFLKCCDMCHVDFVDNNCQCKSCPHHGPMLKNEMGITKSV